MIVGKLRSFADTNQASELVAGLDEAPKEDPAQPARQCVLKAVSNNPSMALETSGGAFASKPSANVQEQSSRSAKGMVASGKSRNLSRSFSSLSSQSRLLVVGDGLIHLFESDQQPLKLDTPILRYTIFRSPWLDFVK